LILDATNQNQAHVKAIAANYRRKTNLQNISNAIKRKSKTPLNPSNNTDEMMEVDIPSVSQVCVCINEKNSACSANKHIRLFLN
jgi:hypothetical protein